MTPRLACVAERQRNLYGPYEALKAAIERLRDCLPAPTEALDERELVEMAAHDVLRAIVHVRRSSRDLECEAIAMLDRAAFTLGVERLQLGRTGSVG